MALRSQLITKEFPELDRVERLNNEAFPEDERIPLIDFLKLDGRDDYHFFAFYDEDDFVGFASVLYNAKVFYVSFFAIVCQIKILYRRVQNVADAFYQYRLKEK